MKRILFFLLLLTISLTANAQIENLDEIELLGTWNVVDKAGIFNTSQFPVYNSERKRPVSITFSDNNNSIITWEYASGTDYQLYPGYWLSHTSNRYILHMVSRIGYDGYTSLSLLNFVVTKFSNGTMTLTTYDGNGTIYLAKENSTGVRAVSDSNRENGKDYQLNGSVAAENAKGVIISDGIKIVR